MASIVFQLKRGTDVDHQTYDGSQSELTHQTTNHGLVLHEHYTGIVTSLVATPTSIGDPSVSYTHLTLPTKA